MTPTAMTMPTTRVMVGMFDESFDIIDVDANGHAISTVDLVVDDGMVYDDDNRLVGTVISQVDSNDTMSTTIEMIGGDDGRVIEVGRHDRPGLTDWHWLSVWYDDDLVYHSNADDDAIRRQINHWLMTDIDQYVDDRRLHKF